MKIRDDYDRSLSVELEVNINSDMSVYLEDIYEEVSSCINNYSSYLFSWIEDTHIDDFEDNISELINDLAMKTCILKNNSVYGKILKRLFNNDIILKEQMREHLPEDMSNGSNMLRFAYIYYANIFGKVLVKYILHIIEEETDAIE